MNKFKSRKTKRNFNRRSPQISGDIILIVCEGSKTEPNYFKDLKRRMRIPAAQIKVIGKECGSAPISVVDFAIEEKKNTQYLKYDQIWCVIDTDNHTTLNEALDKANGNVINIALSCQVLSFGICSITYTQPVISKVQKR